ncbi:hypothetical protein BV25DRAFT_1794431 [Artomyces pyxidatus]|uniref:Uncharacterized protein n=1 Tax=Artomyces pyxidatus TaxID=48021 RepID=A0ACB8THH8_9AGAM|nr:hypothetical protein BV25DRAFT_1794431 [Artomyces pyxidatus]
MTPYLHFTRGDNLFFKSWAPSSAGAVVGACIGLFVLALLERLVFAGRGVMEAHWRQRLMAMTRNLPRDSAEAVYASGVGKDAKVQEFEVDEEPVLEKDPGQRVNGRRARMIAPFVASHDITRGVLYALQALLAYALMLAVMTFQAAYIITIILGLGIGEVMFGRFASLRIS